MIAISFLPEPETEQVVINKVMATVESGQAVNPGEIRNPAAGSSSP